MTRDSSTFLHPRAVGTGEIGTPAAAPPISRPSTAAVVRWLWGEVQKGLKRPFYALYLRRLRSKAHAWQRPKHLGIVMDGNRRFARESGLVSVAHGHNKGADKLQEVLGWCLEQEISVVTVWCFSIENFQRSTAEVEDLLGLFEHRTRQMAEGEEIHRRRLRVRFIGRLELLPESLRQEIRRVEEATEGYDQGTLNIAMAYGGREEIADAFRSHVRARLTDGEAVDEILEKLEVSHIGSCLYTSGQPEPDLILRTSGELRLSGFLLWQSAQSELYFCDANWPAFREIDFLRALRSYDARHRRFGR
ncbi:MAG: polyprenyl diphosphate synthase [Holophagales bacterium]|nr:polyprenyl diphosphate synthase [Holophagales bacterium]